MALPEDHRQRQSGCDAWRGERAWLFRAWTDAFLCHPGSLPAFLRSNRDFWTKSVRIREDSRAKWAAQLEGAAKSLIPGLGGGDADQFVLIVAGIEVEVGEELRFWQGIRRVDTEEGLGPRWCYA